MLITALLAVSALAQVPESVDPSLIPNYSVVRPSLAAGGQPTNAEPGVAEEEAAVKAAGLRYVRVPVSPDTFRAEDVAAVKAVLDDPSAAPMLQVARRVLKESTKP